MTARRPSLRAAIDQHCKNCLYDPGRGNGAWREQIDRCSSTNCALWPVRPRSDSQRLLKAGSLHEEREEEPVPTVEPEESVDELLGGLFARHGGEK
jgi:hypothetical protein